MLKAFPYSPAKLYFKIKNFLGKCPELIHRGSLYGINKFLKIFNKVHQYNLTHILTHRG